jgi:hypothetical protein
MKKFLLTSCAILSAIGVQAQTTFTQGNVTYEAEQIGTPTVQHEQKDTVSTYETSAISSSGMFMCQQEIQHEITTQYKYNATAKKIGEVPSVSLYNFNIYTGANTLDGSRTVTGNLGNYTVYEVGSQNYIEEFSHLKDLESSSIYSYDQMANDTDPIAEYSYFVKNSKGIWIDTPATGITDANLYRTGYFYKYEYNNNKYYCQIQNIGLAKKTTTLNHRNDSCTVIAIKKNAALANEYITSISLGKDITSIGDMAFMSAENLSNFSVQNGGHYVYQNGILYNSDRTDIEVAGCNVQSQVIPSSVSTIKKYAFFNTVDEITITSMNSSLNTNEAYQGANVTFITPSASLTVTTDGTNGGYKVTGNVTQANINNVTIQGTYMDFRGATVLEDIDITNVGNTLLYFATDKNVTGNKNIVNNNVCANCVITDNASDKFYCPSKFTATNLSYSRKFDALWRTATFPFSTNDATVNDQILTGEFRGYMEDYHLFNFVYSQSIVANRPYIIKTESDDENASFRFENLSDATVEVTNPMQVKQGPAYFYGNFDTQTLTSTDATFYYGITNTLNAQTGKYRSEVVKCVGATIKPFRAYLSGPATATANSARIRLVDAMDQVIDEIEMPMTTGIEDVKTEEAITDKVYNLNGQSVKASRGLNIINGKVVINK